jgi:uncharacterized protein (DUF305 family)
MATNDHKETGMTRSNTPRFALAALVAAALGLPLMAQTMDHSAHDMSGVQSAATTAYMEANMRMHAEMGAQYTDNADVDFIAGMIPHHQGAVDMARIVLEHGSDPEVKVFAQGVIDAQEAEIAWMTDWLARNKP